MNWLNGFADDMDDLLVSGRYAGRKDFTVVLQPTLIRGQVPRARDGRGGPDLDYLGPDCFHFAQKTHALSKLLLIFHNCKKNKTEILPILIRDDGGPIKNFLNNC
jgi:hypothetical protein